MKTLGIGTWLFRGLAAALDFNVFPFIDSTGRHTFTGSVTQTSGKGDFNGSTQLVAAASNDFCLATRLDVTVTLNRTAGGSDRIIWALYNGESDLDNMEFYHKNDGRLFLNLGNPTAFIDTFVQTGYVLPAGVDTVVRVVQESASTWSVYAGGVLRGTVGSVSARIRKARKLALGGYPVTGLRFVGTMEDFTWTNV